MSHRSYEKENQEKIDFLENYREHRDHFGEWMGYRIEEFHRGKGKAKLSLELRDGHLSPAGRVHGGVVSGFLDFACGAAVFTILEKHDLTSTVELKVNFLRPLELGDNIVAHTETVFEGNRLVVVTGKVFRNDQEEPVAIATGTFNRIRNVKKKE